MIRCLLFLFLTLSLDAQTAKTPALVIKAVTDRPDAFYKVGETVKFDITVSQQGKPLSQGKVLCSLSKDGVEPRRTETLDLQNGIASLTGTLGEPGFLHLRVSTPEKPEFAQAGAAFSPLEIAPSLPAPDDFDAFWTAQKDALAQVKMQFTLTAVKSPAAQVEAFDAQVTCLGAPVSGYFGKPQGATPKSCPAILFVHGAGVGDSTLGALAWSAREGGMLSMDINAHGLPNGKPKAFYEEQATGALANYRYQGRNDREQCYFKGMFLRVIRALDFLTAQPEWDGRTLIVYGGSQGGFQAFAAAGLDPRVTFFCAGVPAGCDHTGSVVGRINGWPKLVEFTDGQPSAAGLETARYFDNVNFATRARCKGAAVTVGFIDTVCPPTSVYAAYNALTIPKNIFTMPLTGHKSSSEASTFLTEAALAHVRAMRGN
ncbi:cephalosporin-C deacetylase-like acetyl esterase [Prosthecobacter fusiformis]|uniref:Cephalosporin-C deacetylase-like acetyl esterase n=1 Tax=Prosthecobacter fusiformis TaxID=48464 RepID=A0A4R7RYM5_9BACT|nr:acetylxylan esterase [Prosthecobacter fusiformis]TDU71030.1 cephalosporin-C deacetylase-like acetyl esterase [Prosthecobacter fusiformis]